MIEKLGITPGPWEVATCCDEKNSGFENNEGQSVKHSSSWVEDAWSGREADDESKANDRLIAAAPEMLEALIAIRIAFETPNTTVINVDEITKAIEKATNKSWEEIKELL